MQTACLTVGEGKLKKTYERSYENVIMLQEQFLQYGKLHCWLICKKNRREFENLSKCEMKMSCRIMNMCVIITYATIRRI